MAYSDYGGFAYRNGKKVVDRSDCEINPEKIISTPGCWPGFRNLLNKTNWPYHHVVLGDGPMFIGMSKSSYVSIYDVSVLDDNIKEVDLVECLSRKDPGATKEWEGEPYLNNEYFINNELPCLCAYKTNRIEIYFTEEDNFYQYIRVEQPDGVIWCGWAGYGVGAGLEDCGYGYSTEARDAMLLEYWPDAIK